MIGNPDKQFFRRGKRNDLKFLSDSANILYTQKSPHTIWFSQFIEQLDGMCNPGAHDIRMILMRYSAVFAQTRVGTVIIQT